jgi:enoyl-CoA hydratase/carnithine racemase
MIAIKDFTDVTYKTDSGVGIITINRPDRYNALRGRTVDELLAAFKYAWVDQEVGAVILTGAGEKAFCTGGDQKERAATGGYGETETGMFEIESLHKLIRAIPKPVIAAVNGAAAGLGLVQALMCDIRFAADTAKFTCAFSKRGLIAEYGISWVLPRLVGQANALDLLMSSRVILADEAHALGMVNKVVPAAQLMDVVMAYAADLAMNVSPSSMSVMKRQVYGDYSKDVSTASKDALVLMGQSFGRPDFKEGVQSFVQKRQAEFPPVDPTA